jgi:hypothetical protein
VSANFHPLVQFGNLRAVAALAEKANEQIGRDVRYWHLADIKAADVLSALVIPAMAMPADALGGLQSKPRGHFEYRSLRRFLPMNVRFRG